MITAILLCAGKSTRFSGGLENKTLYRVNGKPLFLYSLEVFESWGVSKVVLVVRKHDLKVFKEFTVQFNNIEICFGGERRQDSVMHALSMIPNEDRVLIHDGARPQLSEELIERVTNAISKGRCVVPVIPSDDSLRIKREGKLFSLDRSKVYRMQTPQGCIAGELKDLYKRFSDFHLYDDAAAFERAGMEIFPIEGDRKNVKITTKDDLIFWNVENRS